MARTIPCGIPMMRGAESTHGISPEGDGQVATNASPRSRFAKRIERNGEQVSTEQQSGDKVVIEPVETQGATHLPPVKIQEVLRRGAWESGKNRWSGLDLLKPAGSPCAQFVDSDIVPVQDQAPTYVEVSQINASAYDNKQSFSQKLKLDNNHNSPNRGHIRIGSHELRPAAELSRSKMNESVLTDSDAENLSHDLSLAVRLANVDLNVQSTTIPACCDSPGSSRPQQQRNRGRNRNSTTAGANTRRICSGEPNTPQDPDESSPEDDGEDDDSSRKIESDGPWPAKRTRSLACPYWVTDPLHNRKCSTAIIHDIAYLKRHLEINHGRPKHTCGRCLEPFENADALDDHQGRAQHCSKPTCDPFANRMTPGMLQKVKKRTRGGDVTKKWQDIFRTLFVDREIPASPYLDDHEDLIAVMYTTDLLSFLNPETFQTVLSELSVYSRQGRSPPTRSLPSLLRAAWLVAATPRTERYYDITNRVVTDRTQLQNLHEDDMSSQYNSHGVVGTTQHCFPANLFGHDAVFVASHPNSNSPRFTGYSSTTAAQCDTESYPAPNYQPGSHDTVICRQYKRRARRGDGSSDTSLDSIRSVGTINTTSSDWEDQQLLDYGSTCSGWEGSGITEDMHQ